MSLSNILAPSSGCLLGVYPGDSCDTATSYATRCRNHEALINRTASTNGILNVVSSYHDFDDFTTSFPTADEAALAAEGRLLLIHWTPRIFGGARFLWADVSAGNYDAQYIDPTARAIRDYGKKVFVAFHNEMNASSSAQGGVYGTDAQYATAAQHVHDRFITQGATNVIWVFKPSGYTDTISRMSTLYPGDAYVDWIMWDPYAKNGEDFDYVMTVKYPMYQWATVTKSGSHTKPLGFAEWAAFTSSGPTSKDAYIEQVRTGLASYPLVKLIAWFNSTNNSECLNTSAPVLAAYKNLADDTYFLPDMATTPPPPAGTGAFRVSGATNFSNTASKALAIPATIQAGDGMVLLHASTRTGLKNACEGTNAANVTVGNSNTVGSNPWDSVSANPPTYSTTQAHTGSTSIHPNLSAQTTSKAAWDAAFGAQQTGVPYYGRAYFYRTAAPTQITRFYQQNSSGGTTSQWGIGLDTAGKIIVRDIGAGATRFTSTNTPGINLWHRVEWKATWNGSTTTVDVRIYIDTAGSETTLDESGSSTAFNQAAAGGQYNFGLQSPSQTYDLFMDDVGLDFNTWMGQAPHVSAVLTAPSGWTEIVPTGTQAVASGAGELATKAYRRTAVAGDPGSNVTLATDVNAHGGILLLSYSGVDPLALVDVSAASTKNTDSTSVTTPTVTTTGNGEWIVSAGFVRDNPGGLSTSWSLPGGQVQRAAAFPAGAADGRVAAVACDDATAHAAGLTTAQTLTATVNSYLGVAYTIALKPSAATGDIQSAGYCGIPS